VDHGIVTSCWFSCRGSGRTWLHVGTAASTGAVGVTLTWVLGRTQPSRFFQEGPDSAQATVVIRFLTPSPPGKYLADGHNVPLSVLPTAPLSAAAQNGPAQAWSAVLAAPDLTSRGHLAQHGNSAPARQCGHRQRAPTTRLVIAVIQGSIRTFQVFRKTQEGTTP
jgi:hypothetical protein